MLFRHICYIAFSIMCAVSFTACSDTEWSGDMCDKQVLMRSSSDCGIPCEANALGMTYEFVAKYFAIDDKYNLADINDSMIHHKVMLYELNIRSRIVDLHDILEGRCKLQNVCMLIHDPDNPTYCQHWVNVGGVDTQKMTITLLMNMEKCKTRTFTWQEMYDLYTKGMFNHAHEVHSGSVRVPAWYEFAYVWITKRLF